MPSRKFDMITTTTIAFGDLDRDEINALLSQAGVSLAPPKKTPFATGIRRKQPKKAVAMLNTQATLNEDPVILSSPAKLASISKENPMPGQVTTKPQLNGVTYPDTKINGSAVAETVTDQSPAAMSNSTTSSVSPAATSPPLSPEPVAATPKQKPASWAALIRSNVEKLAVTKPGSQTTTTPVAGTPPSGTTVSKNGSANGHANSFADSKVFADISDIIQHYEPRFDAPLLEPRGLINNVNTCFMNVILQPLLHCPPFYNLVKTTGSHVVHSFRSKTPLLDSLIEFTNEFKVDDTKPGQHNPEPYGDPFVPEYVYNALREQKRFDSLRGRQEDAEEFLCCLLDGLHEEMVAVMNGKKAVNEKNAVNGNGQASDWLEVGRNNKMASVNAPQFETSPISKIFGGRMRSTLRCPGAKDSVNLEPFQSLPLDIQPDNVKSIEDAIHNLTIPEIMHGFMSPKGVRVDATKQICFEGLPPVLVLHMKRFVFDNVGGVQKLQKPVQYGSELVFQPEWLSPVILVNKPIRYRLFASVYHHGASAGGGHYTCDVQRKNGEWLHFDDTNIAPVSEQDVLVTDKNTRVSEKLHADRTAYILFYIRHDEKRQ